jgi:methylated-DNA-protein-cysteine methyltransferase-like protein
MARSDEAEAFFHAVYSAVQEVPHGKVTSYGHIARLIGTRKIAHPYYNVTKGTNWLNNEAQRPRQVGICLKHLSTDENARFNSSNVPWQRIIGSQGKISPRSQPSGARNQAIALEREGVTVMNGAMGELMIDLDVYGWFPDILPSEDE